MDHDPRASHRRALASIRRALATVRRVIAVNRRIAAEFPDHRESAEKRVREGEDEIIRLESEQGAMESTIAEDEEIASTDTERT